MRILLDECVPRPLREHFPGHEVRVVPELGWASLSDDALLRIVERRFDVLITTDRRLPFVTDVAARDMGVIILLGIGTRLVDLLPLVPRILSRLDFVLPGTVTYVE